jgi:hypothetical protein
MVAPAQSDDYSEYSSVAHAVAGQQFTMTEPFGLTSDPAALLEP